MSLVDGRETDQGEQEGVTEEPCGESPRGAIMGGYGEKVCPERDLLR